MTRSWVRRMLPAMLLLAATTVDAVAQHRPADSPTSRRPGILGIALRDSSARVLATLGPPEQRATFFAFHVWEYPQRGVTLIWSEGDSGLRVIVIAKRSSGDVDGVRIGDSFTAAKARWGQPTRTRLGGRYADFTRTGWILSAQVDDKKISEITLVALGDS